MSNTTGYYYELGSGRVFQRDTRKDTKFKETKDKLSFRGRIIGRGGARQKDSQVVLKPEEQIKKVTPDKKPDIRTTSSQREELNRQIAQRQIVEQQAQRQSTQFTGQPTTQTLQAPGTIYAVQTGQVRNVPTYSTYYVKEDYSTRPLTDDESKKYQNQLKALSEENSGDAPSKFKRSYGEVKGTVIKVLDKPINRPGTADKYEKAVAETTRKGLGYFKLSEATKEDIGQFTGGVARGFIPETRGELLATGGSFALGGAVGGGAKAVGIVGAKLGGKVGGAVGRVITKGDEFAKVVKGTEFAMKGSKGTVYVLEKGVLLGGTAVAGMEAVRFSGEAQSLIDKGDYGGLGKSVGTEARNIGAFIGGVKVGSKVASVVQGKVRTRGATEIPETDVIAPESLAGQRYPTGYRGQTAKALKQEFYEPVSSLQETPGKPRGFTASPGDFEKVTIIQPGSSEVPGLFSAPRLNPTFLRVGGEDKIGFATKDFLGVGEPTAFRVEFNSLEFAPGVKGSTKLGKGKFDKKFFESIEGTGKTFIPSAKTEKEAITSFGSLGRVKDTGKFIKVDGINVPIKQLEIVPTTARGGKGVKSIGEIGSSSYYKPPVKSSFTPLDLFSGISSSKGGRKSSGSYFSKASSYAPRSSLSSISKASEISSSRSSKKRSSALSYGSLSSYSSIPSGSGSGSGGSSSTTKYPKELKAIFGGGKRSSKSKKSEAPGIKASLREPLTYAPDFTARTLRIKTKNVKRKAGRSTATTLGIRGLPQ